MQRARSHGDSPEGLAVIEAHAWQCAELVRLGDEAAKQGKSTAWYQWRLERKDRHDYGTKIEVAAAAPDLLAGLSDEQLRRIADGESYDDVTRHMLGSGT